VDLECHISSHGRINQSNFSEKYISFASHNLVGHFEALNNNFRSLIFQKYKG
jgi:hypothetical protein